MANMNSMAPHRENWLMWSIQNQAHISSGKHEELQLVAVRRHRHTRRRLGFKTNRSRFPFWLLLVFLLLALSVLLAPLDLFLALSLFWLFRGLDPS